MSTGSKEETRAKILEAGYRLLIDRGYHGVGIDEIARAAGVSRQAVYQHHFKNKSDLFVAIVAHSDDQRRVGERASPILQVPDAIEGLDRMVELMVTVDGEILEIAQVIEGARLSDPAAEAAWQNRMKSRAGFVKAVIGRLAEQGKLAKGWTVDDAADFAWAFISPATYRALIVDKKWSQKRYIARARQVLHDTLLQDDGRTSRP